MTEVSTLITDYLLGGLTALLAVLLLRNRERLPARLWGLAFLASALGAFAGGTWHGFQLLLSDRVLFWLWKVAVYSVGVFGLAAVSGSIVSAITSGRRAALLMATAAIAATYAVWMATHDDFIYVVYYNAAVMGFVLAVHAYTGLRRRDPASPWMIAGVLVSVVAALVQVSGLSLHRHFNNNDLFHVIQMAGVYLLFRGAQRL